MHAVDRRSQAVAMHDAHLELSFALTLLGSSGQPVNGGDIVTQNTFSPRIDETKLHLGDDNAAIGQRRKQLDGMRVILQGISDKGIGQLIGCRDLMEQGEATQNDTDAQALPK
jgi:hypothetical protein